MKKSKSTVLPALAEDNQTPKAAIQALLESNPNGGEITLQHFSGMLPGIEKREIIAALKGAPTSKGVFVVGRRGYDSRFVFGQAGKELAARMAERANYTPTRRGRGPGRPRKNELPGPVASFGGSHLLTNLSLRVMVGNQETVIPIKAELVDAAA